MIGKKKATREAKQLFRLCQVNSVVDENRVREVVQQVIASGHHTSHIVLTQLLRLLRLDSARRTAQVESAMPLSEELQATTSASLRRLYGPVAISFSGVPSLIGGMRIRVGCDVYDGSVLGGLIRLEKRF